MARDIGQGMRLVFGHRILRPLTLTAALTNLCMDAMLAILILYAHRDLGLGSVAIGILMSLGAVCGIAGALVIGRAPTRPGAGPVLLASLAATGLGMAFIPLAGGSRPVGALAWGLLGAAIGLRPTLAAAAAAFALSLPLLWGSAVRSLGPDAGARAG